MDTSICLVTMMEPSPDRMTLVHVQPSHQALKAATATKSDCQLEPWGIVLMLNLSKTSLGEGIENCV